MTSERADLGDADLHAYLDGELEPPRRAEVEAWLAEDHAAAARLQAFREQKSALASAFDPVLEEPVPDRLDLAAMPRGGGPRRWVLRAAAAAILLMIGGVGGWFANDWLAPSPAGGPDLAREAVNAHRVYAGEVRHPVEVGASEEKHLVAWLSKRLGAPLRAPDLAAVGYQLVGGRLLPATVGPSAQFMYEAEDGARLTLYVRANPAGGETAFRFAKDGDVAAFYWLEGPLGYALIGRAERQRMLELSRVVYDRLHR